MSKAVVDGIDEATGQLTHAFCEPRPIDALETFRSSKRGFDAVVIGEPQLAFHGNQFGLTFPVFVYYGIELWLPEVDGAVDPGFDAQDLVMSLYGGMSKGKVSEAIAPALLEVAGG